MKPSPDEQERAKQLRQQAEEALRGHPVDLGGLPVEDIQRVIHELQVHQTELILQNDELCRVQAELEAARKRYADLYHFAPAGYCTLDGKGRILEANQTLAELLGVELEKLLQQNLTEYVEHADQDEFYLHRQRVYADHPPQVDVIRMVRQGGDSIFVRLESVRAHDEETRLSVMLSDISEQKRAEDGNRAIEERLKLATEAGNIGIWEWDFVQGELSWDTRCKAIFGLPLEMVMNLPVFLNAIHPDDRDIMERLVPDKLVAAKIYESEYRVIWPDGSQHWVLDIGQGSFDETGKPTRMTGIVMDITRQKLQEKKLIDNAAELEKLNREIQDFAFIASHDMQEPLRKIRTFGSLLLQGKTGRQIADDEQDYLIRMDNAAVRLQMMLEGLLAYSRITTKAQPYARVNLSQIVSEVRAGLELRLHQTKGEVELGELPEVEADPHQMRLLFHSLIDNALKFTRPGVVPQVKVTAIPASLNGDNPQTIQVLVEDNGIGLDMAHAGQLFQPFHRLVGRSAYDGAGIGLAIARKIVERHAGQITVQSTPGQGSTFIVTLPVKQ
jgi:PAS domain S-box-containing protein